MKISRILSGAALAVCLFSTTAGAQTVISAVSGFPAGHLFSSRFEEFVKEFNAANGAEIRIDYKGGAPAVGSPFTLGGRVQQGQFDLMSNPGPYYESTVPAALSLILANDKSITELRKTDWIDAMQEAHRARGLFYLGKLNEGAPFHLYVRKPLEKATLSGLRLRVAPHYQPFFGALGATTVRSDIGEVYTLMENGSINGFGWPIIGFLPDWLKITPYRVEPGFYDTDLNMVFSLNTWNRLTDKHKKLFTDLRDKYEANAKSITQGWATEARKKMEAAGMKVVELKGVEGEKFSKAAVDTAWEQVISRDPAIGKRLRKATYGE